MRVLIAPQEFKGTLSAREAADAIAAGVRQAFPEWELHLLPMADGGPGTAVALLAGAGGETLSARVHDPVMRPIEAEFVRLGEGTAVVECAAASGIWRLSANELDPQRATTYGTGELVLAALAAGATHVMVGLGGSATNDGGAGLAQALGFHLLDEAGRELPPGGAALAHLVRIDASSVNPALRPARFMGASDVTNPLCGPNGASAVFGPQKGADAGTVAELDNALGHFAAIVQRDLGVDVRDRPGAGASGGLGAGLIAFLGAELVPGAELVAEAIGLKAHIREADVVITGEGRLDGQTAAGKATRQVALLARATGRPVICLTGTLGPGYEALEQDFDVIEVTSSGAGLPSVDEARGQVGAAAVRAVLRLSDGRGVNSRA